MRDKVEPLFLADFKLIQGNKIAQIPKSQKSEVREKGDKVFTPLSEPDKGQKLRNTVAFRVQDQALSYVAHDEELHVILEVINWCATFLNDMFSPCCVIVCSSLEKNLAHVVAFLVLWAEAVPFSLYLEWSSLLYLRSLSLVKVIQIGRASCRERV